MCHARVFDGAAFGLSASAVLAFFQANLYRLAGVPPVALAVDVVAMSDSVSCKYCMPGTTQLVHDLTHDLLYQLAARGDAMAKVMGTLDYWLKDSPAEEIPDRLRESMTWMRETLQAGQVYRGGDPR